MDTLAMRRQSQAEGAAPTAFNHLKKILQPIDFLSLSSRVFPGGH